jgi:hypothetical protein
LFFLPFAALLIGSGGFYSEYKDNAWIYLFSRPIKKELIWIFKYVSQLSILVAIFFVFFFVRQFFPNLDRILQDLDFQDVYFSLISLSVYVVIPLMAFTVGFSLSLLYDKQFIIFFTSILVGLGLLITTQSYIQFLWMKGYRVRNDEIFYLFFALSFVFASILTLAKSDFSQAGKKIFRFSTYALIFLIISFFISTLWVTRGLISYPTEIYLWIAQEYQGNIYFQDYKQGIFRFDSETEKIEKLNKEARFSPEPFSLKAGKIGFLQIKSRRQRTHDLWIMNADGSGARPLVESSKAESPFYKKPVESFILSCEGNKVAFVTIHRENVKREKRTWIHTLWWMNTDGTGLKNRILDVPYGREARLIAWPRFEESLVVEIRQKAVMRENSQITIIDLEKGTCQVLVEGVLSPRLWHPSPDQDYLTFTVRNPGKENDRFILLNLQTFETIDLFARELIAFKRGRWSPDGRQIVFFQPRELRSDGRVLVFYDLEEQTNAEIYQQNYGKWFRYDWTSDGQKFLIMYLNEEENRLVIKNKNFEEEKTIQIPEEIKGAYRIWGLENGALLKGTGKTGFWRVDLESEAWKKVY